MKRLKVRKRFKLLLLGLIILIVDSFVFVPSIVDFIKQKHEEVLVTGYINDYKDIEPYELSTKKRVKKVNQKYIGILEIPSINLKKGLVDPYSKDNNVNKNVEIIKPYHMPNEQNRVMILASHSGTSKVAYFNNLKNVELNENVYIYYNNKKYKYRVIDKYKIKKVGYFNLKEYNSKTLLALVTCDTLNKKKQIVVICELVN